MERSRFDARMPTWSRDGMSITSRDVLTWDFPLRHDTLDGPARQPHPSSRREAMRTSLNPPGVFPPRGNYVHAVVVSAPTLVFVAGQTAVDEQGNVVGKGD